MTNDLWGCCSRSFLEVVGILWVLLLRGEGSRTEAVPHSQALLQGGEKAHVRLQGRAVIHPYPSWLWVRSGP